MKFLHLLSTCAVTLQITLQTTAECKGLPTNALLVTWRNIYCLLKNTDFRFTVFLVCVVLFFKKESNISVQNEHDSYSACEQIRSGSNTVCTNQVYIDLHLLYILQGCIWLPFPLSCLPSPSTFQVHLKSKGRLFHIFPRIPLFLQRCLLLQAHTCHQKDRNPFLNVTKSWPDGKKKKERGKIRSCIFQRSQIKVTLVLFIRRHGCRCAIILGF